MSRQNGHCMTPWNPVLLTVESGNDQRGVRATESERVRHRIANPELACLVRYEVEDALWILIVEIDRRRHDAGFDGLGTNPSLDGARCTEQVPHHRLGRAHPEFLLERVG